MTTYFASGSPDAELSREDILEGLKTMFAARGLPQRAFALPPDYTRLPSRAGEITCLCHELLGERLKDVMPALGTHKPMTEAQLNDMFPGLPHDLIRIHRWRDDVVTLGEVPAAFVNQVTEGIYDKAWPAQVNRLLVEGQHDMILSIGQVVPHEVIGMANYNKNVFVGTGGVAGINESHFLSAVWGIERTLGQANTPLRQILNFAQDSFCAEMPLMYILTVIGTLENGATVTRGLFIGDDHETFFAAARLALEVNFTKLPTEPKRMVAYLDPHEFHSTWLGNKSIYRTRLAMADAGDLIVLAPGVRMFGEDEAIDALIRKYGYRPGKEILELTRQNADLAGNLSAAAHLVHGSTENRFSVHYATGGLSKQEVESVHYQWAELDSMMQRYPVDRLQDGWNTDIDGEPFFFIRNPALGLWAAESRLAKV
jgi:nickel-dependent lactate racemase